MRRSACMARWSSSWLRIRTRRPALIKDINALSKFSVPWKPKTNTVAPQWETEPLKTAAVGWLKQWAQRHSVRGWMRSQSIRDIGGVRVDEVTRDADPPQEVSGRREAPEGGANRRHDRRVRAHGRRSRARDQDRAGSGRHS